MCMCVCVCVCVCVCSESKIKKFESPFSCFCLFHNVLLLVKFSNDQDK